MHGAKFEKGEKEDTFKFKDPKDYEHMPMKERKELTEKMKKKHMLWAVKDNPMGKVN